MNYKNKILLRKQYIDKKMTTYQIAEICNCDPTAICNWLRKYNIPIRSRGEACHLANGNHCNLSQKAKEWIDGELMGDGSLRLRSKYSAEFNYTSKYLEYINYVSNTLRSFGIKQSGKIRKYYYKEMDCYTYHYHSLCYVDLLPIRKRWYPNNKKIIPRDLKLTPLLLRQEYLGDGSLHHYKKSRPAIELFTNGFLTDGVKWLIGELSKLGFKSTRQPSRNSIHISTYSTKDFLSYIGECPVECYQYKWNY